MPEINSSSSSTTKEAGEDIMIYFDNSWWMESIKSPMYKEQAEAIKLYCSTKINSHSKNTVCVSALSERDLFSGLYPTRDLSKIMDALYNSARIASRYVMLDKPVWFAKSVCFGVPYKQKRIVLFVGGPLIHTTRYLEQVGELMKAKNLACDVINFGDPYMHKKIKFNSLIHIIDNNNGNANFCHVPPELSISQALSRSQIITPRVGGSPSAQSDQHDITKQTVEICVKAAIGAPGVLGDCPFCQWVLLTLEEKKVSYLPRFIDMKNKPEWFVEANPDGMVPLINFGDGNWVSNSDVIVEMIIEKYPKPALLNPPELSSLGLKILLKAEEFIKSEDDKYDIEGSLLGDLEELDSHLLQHGPYVNGRKITAVDLRLAPTLYQLGVARDHFKKWTIPVTLTHVRKYAKLLFKRDSFKKTKPSMNHVIAGWEAKVKP